MLTEQDSAFLFYFFVRLFWINWFTKRSTTSIFCVGRLCAPYGFGRIHLELQLWPRFHFPNCVKSHQDSLATKPRSTISSPQDDLFDLPQSSDETCSFKVDHLLRVKDLTSSFLTSSTSILNVLQHLKRVIFSHRPEVNLARRVCTCSFGPLLWLLKCFILLEMKLPAIKLGGWLAAPLLLRKRFLENTLEKHNSPHRSVRYRFPPAVSRQAGLTEGCHQQTCRASLLMLNFWWKTDSSDSTVRLIHQRVAWQKKLGRAATWQCRMSHKSFSIMQNKKKTLPKPSAHRLTKGTCITVWNMCKEFL